MAPKLTSGGEKVPPTPIYIFFFELMSGKLILRYRYSAICPVHNSFHPGSLFRPPGWETPPASQDQPPRQQGEEYMSHQ